MSICQMLNIKYPIICGAMSGISDHKLVAAVGEAGGIGVLGSGSWSGDKLREEIQLIRQLTDKPFGINLMLQRDNIEELVEIAIQEKVALVTTGAGSPDKYIPALKEAGIRVFPVIAAIRHAQKMEKAGADAVIAEGQEAGGHIGQTSTISLIPQIVDAVEIPVVGAGGVGDGRSVAAMFALGASGIQAGTIFLASKECNLPESYKEKLITADERGTVVFGRTLKSPVRALSNNFTSDFLNKEADGHDKKELAQMYFESIDKGIVEGDCENGTLMAGEITGIIKEIRPVQEIIESLFNEAEDVIKSLKI